MRWARFLSFSSRFFEEVNAEGRVVIETGEIPGVADAVAGFERFFQVIHELGEVGTLGGRQEVGVWREAGQGRQEVCWDDDGAIEEVCPKFRRDAGDVHGCVAVGDGGSLLEQVFHGLDKILTEGVFIWEGPVRRVEPAVGTERVWFGFGVLVAGHDAGRWEHGLVCT